MVFGCGTHHGGTADINILDGQGFSAVLTRNSGCKWIQVDHHEINRGDAVFRHHRAVQRPTTENAAMHFRMQGFYAAVHHLREFGVR